MLNDERLEDLRRWTRETHGPHCASLYLPVDTTGTETRRDLLRLRKLMEDAQRRLGARGASAAEIAVLLAPVREIVEAPGAWNPSRPGIAFFLWGETMRRYDVWGPLPELACVGDAPYVKPLLRDRVPDDRFYVLGLSRDDVGLWIGDADALTRIETDAIPRSVEDALGEERLEPTLQQHTVGRGVGPSLARGIFHGQGGGDREAADHQLSRFLHLVDRGLCDVVTDPTRPLVLAGVPRNVGIFRSISRYPTLVEQWVRHPLHAAAWPVALPHLRAGELNARRRFRKLQATERATTDLEEVLRAAQEGRIDTLFAAADDVCLGHFDPDTRRVRLDGSDSPDAIDLVELAVERALAQHADVFTSSAPAVPGGGVVAAMYRF